MKIKRKIIILSIGLGILLLTAIPTYAALSSSGFLSKAQEFIDNHCNKENLDNHTSLLCYLFFKTSELDTSLTSTQNNVANQSVQISDLEKRVTALENPSPTPAICLTPPSGIISWWTGDNTANDKENLNNGAINSGVSFVSGEVGSAFSFNGNDGLMQSPTNSLPTGNSDRTLEFWVKINSFLADVPDPHSSQESFFAGYGNFGSGSQTYQLGTAGNVLYFSSWGSALFGPSLQINKWYHVAVTNTGNSATLYLNGSPVVTGTLTINTPSGTSFNMGRVSGSLGDIRKLNGLIDEATVYNRALSVSEIQSIYNAGANGKCKLPTVVLSDNFNSTSLDTNVWDVFNGSGTYSAGGGFLNIPDGSGIPFIRTKNNPFPATGPFTVEFGIQYSSAGPSGDGVGVSTTPQIYGGDVSNTPVAFWQDNASGLSVVRFGLTVATLGGVNTGNHVVKIIYDGTLYKTYMDNNLVYTSPSSATAQSLWIGNPIIGPTNWSGFKLSYIKITIP